MNLAAHAAGGALAGLRLQGPAAFGAGVASHAVLDMARHTDAQANDWVSALADASLALAVVALVALRHGIRSGPVLGSLGGLLPDAEHLIRIRIFGKRRKFFPTHAFGKRLHSCWGYGSLSGAGQTLLAVIMASLVAAQTDRRQRA